MIDLHNSLNFKAHLPWASKRLERHILTLALIASLGLLLPNHATAQTFTTTHSFGFDHTNGMNPRGDLIISGNSLYGVTAAGGSFSNGVIFKVQPDGTGYTNLHSFSASHYNSLGDATNSDGFNPGGSDLETPEGSLVLSSNIIYGTAYYGGVFGQGTVFRVNTDGTGFTNLHTFAIGRRDGSGLYTNSDGVHPNNNLILSENTLYGTAYLGSRSGLGAVFRISTDGTGFTNLHDFARGGYNIGLDASNSEGALPIGRLALAGNVLYGTSWSGGSSGEGSVFRLNTDGNSFTNLHSFGAIFYPNYTNSDGASPYGGVVLSGNIIYGTTLEGGINFIPGGDSLGTIFAINTDGTGFTNLFNLAELGGAYTYGGLSVAGNTLYGMASYGGSGGGGTVFAFNADGTGFVDLYDFPAEVFPRAGVILSGNILYGSLTSYSNFGDERLFSLSLPQPQLTIVRSGTNVILAWPTNILTFTLQATTNLAATNLWSNVSPASVVVNGLNTVTNPISSASRFYRLSQ